MGGEALDVFGLAVDAGAGCAGAGAVGVYIINVQVAACPARRGAR